MLTILKSLILISILLKSSYQLECITPRKKENIMIQPGGTLVVDSSFENAQRTFVTTAEYNLTLELKDFDADLDCAKGGPVLRVISYPDQPDAPVITGCYKRMREFEYPVISSDKITVKHCNGGPGNHLRYLISTKLAGFVYVTREKKRYKIFRHRELNKVQWITLTSQDNNYAMQINVKELKLGKVCRRSYLKITETANRRVVEKLCSKNDNYERSFSVFLNSSTVNITFKKASFQLETQLVEQGSDFNEISSSIETTGMIVMTDMTTETTDMTVEEEDSVVNDKISNNKGSQYLFYVCLGGGVALVVIILVFGVYCWKKNFFSISKTQQSNLQTSKVNKTHGDQRASPNNTQSLSNAMYGRIVKGQTEQQYLPPYHFPSRNHFPNQQISAREIEEKRRIRLSQLADKYIDVELPEQTSRPLLKQGPDRSNNFRYLSDSNQAVTDSRATFNHTRPPLPLPQLTANSNKYESIKTHLNEKDMVAPAYCSLEEERENLFSPLSDAASTQGSLPIGEYGFSQRSKITHNKYIETRVSSDTFDISDANDENDKEQNSKLLPQPNIGKDGYLSLLSAVSEENRKSMQNLYVSPNKVTNENIENHFNKPEPKPGKELENSTSVNLVTLKKKSTSSIVSKFNKLAEENNVKHEDKLMETIPDHDFQPHLQISEHRRYKAPRPSAPEIFVKSAYTSSEDVENIRKRLEKIVTDGQQVKSTQSETKLSTFEVGLNHYDSPASSSKNSLIDSQSGYYDTPRPSLAQIFPIEEQ